MPLSTYLIARENNPNIIDHNGTIEGILTLIASREPGERIFQDESGKLAKAKNRESTPQNTDLDLYVIFTHVFIRIKEERTQPLPKQLLHKSLKSISNMNNKYCDSAKINCISSIMLSMGFDTRKSVRTSAELLQLYLNNELMKYEE